MKHHRLISKAAAALAGFLTVFTLALSCEKAVGAPAPVTIILDNSTKPCSDGTFEGDEGVFEATGALNAAGCYTMAIVQKGTKLTCDTVLSDSHGTITLKLQCRLII